jgi:hypothetical protein
VAIVCTSKNTIWMQASKHVSGLLILLLVSVNAFAAPPPSAAQCQAALTLQNQTDLNFGSTLVGSIGTVTIDPQTGLLTGVQIPSSSGQQAHFKFATGVLDCSKKQPTVTFTTGTITNGTSLMTVSNFTYTTDLTKKTSKNFGTGDFYVGADLSVVGTETAGTYTGSPFTITLTF